MKLIYIGSSIIPSRWANSFQVMKMCQAFRQLGHDIKLVVPSFPYFEERQQGVDIWQHYGLVDRFPIIWLKWSRRLKGGLDYALRAASYATRRSPALVICRNIQAAALTSWRGLPTVLECHAPLRSPFNWAGFRQLRASGGFRELSLTFLGHMSFQGLLRSCGFRKLVVISHALKGHFLKYTQGALTEDKILVCPDGIDLERFENLPEPVEARQRVGLPEATLTFGYAGHLYQGFGIELILELARRLPRSNFLIVGGRDEDVNLYLRQAQDMNLLNVRFLGFVPNAVLPYYLAACDVLLMPYQKVVAIAGKEDTVQWMSPMKMFEYMASGRMIISSDLPVLREILNERNAALCPPEDTGLWLGVAEKAAHDAGWRMSLGLQARAEVGKYTWKCRATKILEEAQI